MPALFTLVTLRERKAKMAEEVHLAQVRAAMAAVALRKGGRRWRPSAARAVVQAVRVAGGRGTIGNGSRPIDEKLGPKMVTTTSRGGANGVTYTRSYPT